MDRPLIPFGSSKEPRPRYPMQRKNTCKFKNPNKKKGKREGSDPMWSTLRSRTFTSGLQQWKQKQQLQLGLSTLNGAALHSSSVIAEEQPHNYNNRSRELLKLDEVEKILSDVKADNVQVIPVPKHYDFADYMVIATGRSDWHVRNIAQALIYKAGSLIMIYINFPPFSFLG